MDIYSRLPEFFGNKYESATNFIKTFEQFSNVFDWQESKTVLLAKNCLKGKAKLIVECNPLLNFTQNWIEFKTKFLEIFRRKQNFFTFEREFLDTVQKPDENVESFACRLQFFAEYLFDFSLNPEEQKVIDKLTDKRLLNQFITGVLPNIKRDLFIQNPETFENALTIAKRIEEIDNFIQGNSKSLKVPLKSNSIVNCDPDFSKFTEHEHLSKNMSQLETLEKMLQEKDSVIRNLGGKNKELETKVKELEKMICVKDNQIKEKESVIKNSNFEFIKFIKCYEKTKGLLLEKDKVINKFTETIQKLKGDCNKILTENLNLKNENFNLKLNVASISHKYINNKVSDEQVTDIKRTLHAREKQLLNFMKHTELLRSKIKEKDSQVIELKKVTVNSRNVNSNCSFKEKVGFIPKFVKRNFEKEIEEASQRREQLKHLNEYESKIKNCENKIFAGKEIIFDKEIFKESLRNILSK